MVALERSVQVKECSGREAGVREGSEAGLQGAPTQLAGLEQKAQEGANSWPVNAGKKA